MQLINRIKTNFEVNSLAFSPDSSAIAASGFQSSGFEVFDSFNGKTLRKISHSNGPTQTNAIHWVSQERIISIYGRGARTIGVWDSSSSNPIKEIDATKFGGAGNLAFDESYTKFCLVSENVFEKNRPNIWYFDFSNGSALEIDSDVVPCNSIFIDDYIYLAGNSRTNQGATCIQAISPQSRDVLSSLIVNDLYLAYGKIAKSPSGEHVYFLGVDDRVNSRIESKFFRIDLHGSEMLVQDCYSTKAWSRLIGVLNEGSFLIDTGNIDRYPIKLISPDSEKSTSIIVDDYQFTFGFSASRDGNKVAFGMESEILIFSL